MIGYSKEEKKRGYSKGYSKRRSKGYRKGYSKGKQLVNAASKYSYYIINYIT